MNLKLIKQAIIFFLISFICHGCTIPCEVYFRNFTGATVHLHGQLTSRWRFEKLPNIVSFYDTAASNKKMLGNWKYQRLINWKDSVNFSIEIPAASVIDLKDVSSGMTLGTHYLDVRLIASSGAKSDTIATGDFESIETKFKHNNAIFSKPVYYYDMR